MMREREKRKMFYNDLYTKENLYNNCLFFTSRCINTHPFVLGLKVDSTDLLKVRLTPQSTKLTQTNRLFVLFKGAS